MPELSHSQKQAPALKRDRKSSSAASRPPSPARHPILALAEAAGNGGLQRLLQAAKLQPKLSMSQPGDASEREADQVADRVMRMTEPSPPLIQRMCSACEEPVVQRKELPGESVEARIGALEGAGTPLPHDVRGFFGSRMGHDFSSVRVHSGGEAAAAARSVNARAFTVGRNIVFGAGEYAPATTGGQHLLAHELTHVVQQQTGVPALQRQQPAGCPPAGAPAPPPSAPAGRPANTADQIYDPRAVAAAPEQAKQAATSYRSMESKYAARQASVASAITKVDAETAKMKAKDKPDTARITQFESASTLLREMKDRWEREGPLPLWTETLMQQIAKQEASYAAKLKTDGKLGELLANAWARSRQFAVAVGLHQRAQTAFFKKLAEMEVWDPARGVRPCVKSPGETKHPATISDAAVEKIKGGAGKTSGEGFRAEPYNAGESTQPCTIGYGHKIKASESKCKVVSPTKCECEPPWVIDKATAGKLLKQDMAGNVAWIKQNVLVDLTQEQLDALVDIMGHVGHMPAELLRSLHEKMCCDPNAVRKQYLNTALGEEGRPERGPIFQGRREERVWPEAPNPAS